MELKIQDLYWIAGLLEGEGSFMKGPPSKPHQPTISLTTTDGDVAEKFANYFNITPYAYNSKRYEENGWKQPFQVKLTCKKAVDLMNLLLPLMSKRRQTQILAALESYKPSDKRLSFEKIEQISSMLLNNNISVIAKHFGVDRKTIRNIRDKKQN